MRPISVKVPETRTELKTGKHESMKKHDLFSDVQVRGYYPNYIKGYFLSHEINIRTEPEDENILKAGTVRNDLCGPG